MGGKNSPCTWLSVVHGSRLAQPRYQGLRRLTIQLPRRGRDYVLVSDSAAARLHVFPEGYPHDRPHLGCSHDLSLSSVCRRWWICGATISPSGGSARYTYQWYASSACITSPISGANGSSSWLLLHRIQHTTSRSMTAVLRVRGPSAPRVMQVTFTLALSAGTITPSSPTIDFGQSITLTANPTSGSAPYAYQWYTGTSCTVPVAGATGQTYSPSPSSNTSYSVLVTDSASTPASFAPPQKPSNRRPCSKRRGDHACIFVDRHWSNLDPNSQPIRWQHPLQLPMVYYR